MGTTLKFFPKSNTPTDPTEAVGDGGEFLMTEESQPSPSSFLIAISNACAKADDDDDAS